MKRKVAEDELNIVNFLKIIAGVLIVFIVFYGITSLVTNKKTAPIEENIQYDKILVGSILNRLESEYYVIVEASDDEEVSNYEVLISNYIKKENHLRFYKVDLSDPFNANYIGEETVLDINNISDIKFNKSTLLHIKDKKIVSYRQGNDIASYLNNLSA